MGELTALLPREAWGKKIKISEDKDGKGPLQGKPLCLMTFLGL